MRRRTVLAGLAGWTLASPGRAAKHAVDLTLRDVTGRPLTLSAWKGNVVLLSFWATWCPTCKEEMPHLQQMHTDLHGRGLRVLGVSMDDARASSAVRPHLRRRGITYPVVLDDRSVVAGAYNPAKTRPFTVLIDREFRIAYEHAGFVAGDEETIRAEVESLLAKATGAPP